MTRLPPEPASGMKGALTRRAPTGRRASTSTDILHQYGEIAAFLRMTPVQVEHRARAKEIPTFKLGRIVCARKSTLLAWMAEQEAKSAACPGRRDGTDASAIEVQLDRIEVVLETLGKRIDRIEKEAAHGERS